MKLNDGETLFVVVFVVVVIYSVRILRPQLGRDVMF